MKNKTIILSIFAMLLSACGGNATPDPALDPNLAMTAAFATVNASFTQTALAVPTNPPAPTETPVPAALPRPTAFVPAAIIQVTVSVPVVYCRFGPDRVYVAPYGLRYGKVREAIGKDQTGDWLLVRESGGKKSCWVIASAVTAQGNIDNLAVAPIKLPYTTLYPPPTLIDATRSGNQVHISWNEVPIQQKDVYLEGHYLLDVWICDNGQLTHKLIGTNNLFFTLIDDISCTNPSDGYIYTSSKAGYSSAAEISWP